MELYFAFIYMIIILLLFSYMSNEGLKLGNMLRKEDYYQFEIMQNTDIDGQLKFNVIKKLLFCYTKYKGSSAIEKQRIKIRNLSFLLLAMLFLPFIIAYIYLQIIGDNPYQ